MGYTIPVILVILIVGIIYYKQTHKKYTDIVVPTPTTYKKDLYFAYYACTGEQARETLDCVNMFWESQFDGLAKTLENIKLMARPTLVDLNPQCFIRDATRSGKNFYFDEDCEQKVTALFNAMREADVLKYIKWFCVIDEPNTNVPDEAMIVRALDTVKRVMLNYPELVDIKFVCIYAPGKEPQIGSRLFDIVGFDDYDKKSTIFSDGTYDAMRAKLLPGQKTLIVPGGAFGQDITPFVNIAHNYSEVVMIIAFTWLGPREPRDTWVGLGDPANPLKEQYIQAGKEIIRLQNS